MLKRIGRFIIVISLITVTLLATASTALAYNTGDDYPAEYKALPFQNSNGNWNYDRWNFVVRNCTSFVAWCLNSRNGVNFTNQYGGVSRWGDAWAWKDVALGLGIRVDNTPAVGAVAWLSSSHVAWVKEVSGSNVVIEEYNNNSDGAFHTHTYPWTHYNAYIHIKDISNQISISTNNMGSVSGIHDGDRLSEGETVSISAVPYSNYIFSKWIIEGVPNLTESTSNPLVFSMPNNDVSVSAQFRLPVTAISSRFIVNSTTTQTDVSISGILQVDTHKSMPVSPSVSDVILAVSPNSNVLASQSSINSAMMSVSSGQIFLKQFSSIPSATSTTISDVKRFQFDFGTTPRSALLDKGIQSAMVLSPSTTYYYRWLYKVGNDQYLSDLFEFRTKDSGSLTSVTLTPNTNRTITAGETITFSYTADKNVDFYLHTVNNNQNYADTSVRVTRNASSGSYNYTFNTAGSFDIYVGAQDLQDVNVAMSSNRITVTVNPASQSLTNVWMTPETEQHIPKGTSVTFSYGANLPSDFYFHLFNPATGVDWSKRVTSNATSGSYAYTFNDPGSYQVHIGAAHPQGDMASNSIYVNVYEDGEKPAISNVSVSDVSFDGFYVTYTATDNVGVTAGELSFWIEGEGNSNAMWVPTENIGGQTWRGYVSATDFGRTDAYYGVNVWAYDASHNFAQYEGIRGIYVPAPPVISGVTFVDRSITLRRGETATSNVRITSSDQQPHSLSELVWTSSDPEIVSVDGNGTITARHLGRTSVYAASPDGTVSDSIRVDVVSNIDAGSCFIVDGIGAYLDDEINKNYGVVCMVREAGQSLNYGMHINFTNDCTGYDVAYTVEEGNVTLNNGTLVIPANASRKNVITAKIYDVMDDGSRGNEMERIPMRVFVKDGGGTLKLPSSLRTIEANALEGTKATTIILPDSLKTLEDNSLAGLPTGTIIYFNSDTITPFQDGDVLGTEQYCNLDYYWIDTGTETAAYWSSSRCAANYYWLGDEVSMVWSDWVSELPAGVSDYETKTQYRSRSVGSQTVYSDWGNWVSNGATPIEQNNLRQVQTVWHDAVTETVYNYRRYKYYNSQNGLTYVSYASGYAERNGFSGNWEYRGWGGKLSFYKNYYDDNVTYPAYGTEQNHWWFEETGTNVITPAYTEYQYRTRTASANPVYGNWTAWQDAPIQGSDTLQVETRTLYRYNIFQ